MCDKHRPLFKAAVGAAHCHPPSLSASSHHLQLRSWRHLLLSQYPETGARRSNHKISMYFHEISLKFNIPHMHIAQVVQFEEASAKA